MKYDYLENEIEDVKRAIEERYSQEEIEEALSISINRRDFEEKLYDELWIDDSVTGNASGSYTCNAYEAEEYIAHNLDLLAEAMQEFGDDSNALKKGAEYCDVTIRCYLLGQAIDEALDELEEEIQG